MSKRSVNNAERYLLTNYQHLMPEHDRMIARSLIAADFDVDLIPKAVWRRVWLDFPGISRQNLWKLPIEICRRLLHNHRDDIRLPSDIASNERS
jgi:hypothetical protein